MPSLERFDTAAVQRLVRTFRDAVKSHSERLNRLNVYPVPDGDTGTNMGRTLDAVVDALDAVSTDDLEATCHAISHGSLMGARGNSGVILSQILRGMSSVVARSSTGLDGATLAEALEAASDGAYQAVLNPMEGTILTVVRRSSEAAAEAAGAGGDLSTVGFAARDAGRLALDDTPSLLPVLAEAGVVDAGGAGFLLLLDSMVHLSDGVPIPEAPDDLEGVGPAGEAFESVARRASSGEVLDVSEQRYEVMYFLDLADERIDEFKSGWGAIGDSIVVVGGDGLWNCHVHTNDIGAAIETALTLDGRPKQIRVTDLFEEVDEVHAQREAAMGAAHGSGPVLEHRAGGGLPPVTTAVVAVTSGDGLVELFGQLGVQGVVTGGQTLNPSTAELLDTVNTVNARDVIVLPNNKNIIPVAEQIDALTEKHVVVVPTVSMPEALAALIVYDPEASADENGAEMAEAADSVRTGEVTQAIRDTSTPIGQVSTGDWIGLVRGDGIVSVGDSPVAAATALLEVLVDGEAELVTVVVGAEAAAADTDEIVAWMDDHRADLAVEVHQGGQPLYPFLFGVE